MKKFIDESATFRITIPATWKYHLHGGKVHTFQEYQIWKSDVFQLSIIELKTDEESKNFNSRYGTLPKTKIGDEEFLCPPDSVQNGFTLKCWIKLYGSNVVMFTFNYLNDPDPELDSRTIDEKISLAHTIISSFQIISATDSDQVINSYRFEGFLQGVGATSLILSNAVANKSFIEATCILANQIDALLRIGIILKNQLNNNNRDIEIEWIYQGLSDKKKTEKNIYDKARDMGIITQNTHDELYALYNDRNRVIHRFIISEITLAEVEEIAYKYSQKQEEINKIIYDLESEQIKTKVGMTVTGKQETDSDHLKFIKGKIGINEYFEQKEPK